MIVSVREPLVPPKTSPPAGTSAGLEDDACTVKLESAVSASADGEGTTRTVLGHGLGSDGADTGRGRDAHRQHEGRAGGRLPSEPVSVTVDVPDWPATEVIVT